MALSRSEIVAKSDEKRGYKNKALKLPLTTIAEIERLAEEKGLSQAQFIVQLVAQFGEQAKGA
ncbi:ribbon-helix-helix protein, CopG family [Histophilus somni]|uniref:ribbon-helix-helix protein, CopG family n=1 Tax=Histophilus somni TaxID=731 RepID=UPI0018EA63AC|nr:ribbon-helix-helix protein, CopG family [Histophilus somni]QQF86378.1 ribbon-helix-helix protein, CopG family [Histophilus somni]